MSKTWEICSCCKLWVRISLYAFTLGPKEKRRYLRLFFARFKKLRAQITRKISASQKNLKGHSHWQENGWNPKKFWKESDYTIVIFKKKTYGKEVLLEVGKCRPTPLPVLVVTPHHVAHDLKLLFLKDYDGAVGLYFQFFFRISSIFLPLWRRTWAFTNVLWVSMKIPSICKIKRAEKPYSIRYFYSFVGMISWGNPSQ